MVYIPCSAFLKMLLPNCMPAYKMWIWCDGAQYRGEETNFIVLKVQYSVHECTYPRLKVQWCWSLFNLSSYLPRMIKGSSCFQPKQQTTHQIRIFDVYLWELHCHISSLEMLLSINTTLVPYLNKFMDYTIICSMMTLEYSLTLEHPLPLATLITLSCLVTLSWWRCCDCGCAGACS